MRILSRDNNAIVMSVDNYLSLDLELRERGKASRWVTGITLLRIMQNKTWQCARGCKDYSNDLLHGLWKIAYLANGKI